MSLVIGHWSLVGGAGKRAFLRRGGVGTRADRAEIGIQAGAQLIQKGLHFLDLGFVQKVPSECPSEPVSGFEQRSPGDSDESPVVLVTSSTETLRDVGSNAVGGTHQLASHCVAGEGIPARSDVPRGIGDLFRQSINPKIFERNAGSLGKSLHGVPITISKPGTHRNPNNL